ncbi:uncharacterized protein LOC119740223 [Patiria miniata]|uniref:LRAT domain-containing protein n=1 Tax=Patiria miniata TaxID=46514 RepID=A0A914B5L8_PATMI|nr:uncharacterized protein LOC119740223 [Patiria miniata]
MASQGGSVVSDESLAKTASALRDTWPSLAEHLGFDQYECLLIRLECSGDVKEQARHMLTAWTKRYNGVDMQGFLIGALRKIGRYDLLGEHGAEIFDDPLLVPLADALGEAWQTLAFYLHLDDNQIVSIAGSFDQVHKQARRMLTVWREDYPGIDMIGQLTKALKRMGKYDLLKIIGLETVDEKSLQTLADELKGVWPEVAEHLGFDDDDCGSIRVAYPEDIKEQAWQMLKALRERHDGLVKMDELKGALKKISRYDLLKWLGEEILETTTIRKIARGLGESWPKLALYLLMDEVQCEAIMKYHSEPWQQAEEMLVLWREDFEGDNPVEHLGRALMMMDREDLAQALVPSQQLQPCGQCGNANPLKMRRYYSKDYEGFTRVIGLCCALCGQEWLSERFLFHPDVDNTRPWVKLGGVVLKEQLEVPLEKNPVFQVKDCRTKIEHFDDISHYIKVGDHITWHRPWGIWHHAVVSGLCDEVGKVKVIHWNKPNCSVSTQIVEEELDLRQQWGDTFRIDYPKEITAANTPELVIARAESRKGDIGYNLLGDNCEAFASYCKTGVAESCQLVWLYRKYTEIVEKALASLADGVWKVGYSLVRKIANDAMAGGGKKAVEAVGEAEFIEQVWKGSNWVGVGLVFAFEGRTCYWDLRQVYEKRKSGGISLKDFIETASRRVSEAIFGAGLASFIGIAGQAAGSFILPGILSPVGAFLGSVVGGTLGLIIGKPLGSIVGPHIGRAITSAMGTDDRAVERIEDLKPGDQVVFYGNLLHPRHHAIVVDRFPGAKKVQVVHNTYNQGVIEEKVDFSTSVFRLVYDERKCYPPDEVIQRARSKIGDETYRYSLVWNNCKHFARWCKLR